MEVLSKVKSHLVGNKIGEKNGRMGMLFNTKQNCRVGKIKRAVQLHIGLCTEL